MRKDTPVSTQLPEWKKEVAEKVKAYGERKKKLTTPPHPLKENNDHENDQEIVLKPSLNMVEEQETSSASRVAAKKGRDQVRTSPPPAENSPAPAELEIWTQDVENILHAGPPATAAGQEWRATFETLDEEEAEESANVKHPFLLRRLAAGAVDSIIIATLTIAVLFGLALFMDQTMEWMILSRWKGSLGLFLLLHFIYHLYFFRSSRQTPGLLFVSLELRDPVLTSIPWSKLLFRWFLFVFLNVFNFVPLVLGKDYLLLDRLSNTQIRSFQ